MLGPHVGITYGLDLAASGVSIRLNFEEPTKRSFDVRTCPDL